MAQEGGVLPGTGLFTVVSPCIGLGNAIHTRKRSNIEPHEHILNYRPTHIVGRMQYDGRTFDESERYTTQQRLVTGVTANRVWLYTVDVATDTENGKSVIQLVRWRARRRGEERRQKTWQRWRFYNIRSSQQWESASRAVDAVIQESSLEVDPSFVRL